MSTHLELAMPEDFSPAPRPGTKPVTHADGLLSVCQVWGDRLDLTIAPDLPSLVRRAALPAVRSLVQVILDGSAAMDRHWAKDSILGSSRVAAAVFQIASRIDPEREELVVGFLSCAHFETVSPRSSALEIEAALNRVREQAGLRQRGAFVRPLREHSLRLYEARRKRIFLLSETEVPDWEDVEDCQVDFCARFRLLAASEAREETALFAADGTLHADLLSACFRRSAVTIPQLCVVVGTELPLEIEPADGTVSLRDGGYRVEWSQAGALAWQIKLRLSGAAPHQVEVSGLLVRDGEQREHTFAAAATPARLEPIGQITCGVLEETDAALWRLLCAPGQDCPECGRRNVHVYHDDPNRLERQPMLSFPASAGQWLLLASGYPEWTMFQTGCRLDGVSVAVVDGILQWSATEPRLERVPHDREEEGLYRLEHGGRTLYIVAVEGQRE